MKISKRISKILLMGFAALLTTSAITSCSSSVNDNSSSIDKPDIPNNGGNNNGNQDPDYPGNVIDPDDNIINPNMGTIDQSIVNMSSINTNDIKHVNSNQWGLSQAYNDFDKNGNFSGFTGDTTKFQNDFTSYVYQLWLKNFRNVTIRNFSFTELNIVPSKSNANSNNNNAKNKINFGDKISFKFQFQVIGIQDNTIFKINSVPLTLNKGDTKIVEISVNDAVFEKKLSIISESIYLGWKIQNAVVKINYQNFTTIPSFSTSEERPSHLFKQVFDNLVIKQNYLELKKEKQSLLNNLSKNELKKSFEKQVHDEFETMMTMISSGVDLVNELKLNPKTSDLLVRLGPSIVNILAQLKIIPKSLTSLINIFISSNEPLVNLIYKNKETIKEAVKNELGDISSILDPILDVIRPGITESDSEYKVILEFVDFLPENMRNLIINDLLGIKGPAKNLLKIFVDNIDVFLNLIPSNSVTSINIIDFVKNILNLVFNEQNYQKPILDVLVGDTNAKYHLINMITNVFGLSKELEEVLEIVFINNKNITVENVKAVLNSLFNFASVLFAKNSTYTNFFNGYKNLEFIGKWSKEPEYNSSTYKISFDYKIDVKIKAKASLSMVELKNLISTETFKKLLLKFGGENNQIIKNLPNDVMPTIKAFVLKIIPDEFVLGDNPKNINFYNTFSFVANNESLDIAPIRSLSNYYLGYQFNYDFKFKLVDHSLLNSITSSFDAIANSVFQSSVAGGIAIDIYYGDIWKRIIENVLLKEYSFKNKMIVQRENKQVIATSSDFDDELYISNYSFAVNSDLIGNNIVGDVWPINMVNDIPQDSKYKDYINKLKWKNSTTYDQFIGKQPYASQDLKRFSYEYYEFANSNDFSQYIYLTPLLNFDLPIQIKIALGSNYTSISFDLKIWSYTVDLLLPFKQFNETTNKMTYNSSVNKTVILFEQK